MLFCFVSDFVHEDSFTEIAFSLYDKKDHYLAVKHGKMVVKVGVRARHF